MSVGFAPGIRREEVAPTLAAVLESGIPVMLGYAAAGPVGEPVPAGRAAGAGAVEPVPGGYLAAALEGFFANGGTRCHVIRLDDGAAAATALADGLEAAAEAEDADLVCVPDVMTMCQDADGIAALQRLVLEHCARIGTRVAILDAPLGAGAGVAIDQARQLEGDHGALYHPWLLDPGGRWVPPSGHVAGVIARVDRAVGFHAAPANAAVEGAYDLEQDLDAAAQAPLNDAGVNCLRAFPGRGIRVWGARTLSRDPAWAYLNVRRLVCSLLRSVAAQTTDVAFEPHTVATRASVVRTLSAQLDALFARGALAGAAPGDAYAVRCDETNNPPDSAAAGRLVADVEIVPAPPAEQVVVRIVRHPAGVTAESISP